MTVKDFLEVCSEDADVVIVDECNFIIDEFDYHNGGIDENINNATIVRISNKVDEKDGIPKVFVYVEYQDMLNYLWWTLRYAESMQDLMMVKSMVIEHDITLLDEDYNGLMELMKCKAIELAESEFKTRN